MLSYVGYHDMGDVWKEELEISDLEKVVMSLYDEIKPLYMMLHAVIRHKLYLKHGPLEIDPNGPIPIHLLGKHLTSVYVFADIYVFFPILLPKRQYVGSRLVSLDKPFR